MSREIASRKAAFCLKTGVQPSEYDQLSGFEINAFIDLVDQRE